MQYSQAIVEFVRSLSAYVYDKGIGGIIRDYERFPERTSFDLDWIVDPKHERDFVKHTDSLASKLNLTLKRIDERSGARRVHVFLLIDFCDKKGKCDWIFIEAHHGVCSNFLRRPILFSDFKFSLNEHGLATPSPSWKQVMDFRKLIKKGKFDACKKLVMEMESNPLVKEYLVDAPKAILTQAQKAGCKEKIIRKRNEKVVTLAEKIFLHTPFRKGTTPLFTIQGPDGVGKTTLLEKMEDIFLHLPFSYLALHHVSSWKDPNRAKKKKEKLDERVEKEKPISFSRKIIKFIYHRLLPSKLRQLYLDINTYNFYAANVNNLMLSARSGERIVVYDRYIDDYFVKQHVKNPNNRFAAVEWLYSRIVERPRVSFLLVDEPKNIIKRKQELTLDEMSDFYVFLRNSIARRNGNMIEIIVTGKTPEQIAVEVIRHILDAIGKDYLRLVRRWKVINESEPS